MTCGKIDLGCTRCRLSKKRTLVVPGNGPCNAKLVLIGEAPGRDEDIKGVPFVGRAGRLLDQALEDAGTMRETVFCTNTVKCRPPGNRKPRKDEIRTCTNLYLSSELGKVRPKVICALGQTAAEYFMDLKTNLSDVIGCEMPVTVQGRQVKLVVSYHPAAILYQRKKMQEFQRSIDAAVKAAGLH